MPFGWPWSSFFLLQYFDCLPTKLDTWCCHSIWKMISASRRIFWDGFQRCLKKCRCSASVFSIVSHLFSNQNKLWNMLQAAFDHEKSFFDTPKRWKPLFQWIFDVIHFKNLHFTKMSKITIFQKMQTIRPVLKYVAFHAEFESKLRSA